MTPAQLAEKASTITDREWKLLEVVRSLPYGKIVIHKENNNIVHLTEEKSHKI